MELSQYDWTTYHIDLQNQAFKCQDILYERRQSMGQLLYWDCMYSLCYLLALGKPNRSVHLLLYTR